MGKKSLISLVLLGALLFAACSPATGTVNNNGSIPQTGQETPGVVNTLPADETTAPADGADLPTAEAESTLPAVDDAYPVVTPTTGVDLEIVETPTTDASTGTGTDTESADTMGPHGQGLVLLNNLRDQDLSSADAAGEVGQVDGVLVYPDAEVDGSLAVQYVAVTIPGENGAESRQVLVPWPAFTAGENGEGLTLNIDRSVLAEAPSFVGDATELGPGWDAEIAQYWQNQGLSIPVTGADTETAANTIVLLGDQLSGIDVQGQAGNVIAEVNDFLLDPQTGELAYAIVQGTESLAGRYFVIPLNSLTWNDVENAAQSLDLGSFTANFPDELFNAAPYLDSIDGIELGQEWQSEVEQYWNGNLNK